MSRAAVVDGAGIAPPLGPFSRAVWGGDLLFVSGQTGTDPLSGRLTEGGTSEETRQALANLSAVLQAAGLGIEDVIKANVYLVDMDEFAAMNEVYAGAFETPRPARTTVAVAGLPGRARVEIELVAHRSRTEAAPVRA